MTRALRLLLLAGAAGLGVYGAWGCYDPSKPIPCDPTTIDWPRCRNPTDPPMVPRDGGLDR